MSVCQNCGKSLNAFTEAYGLTEDADEKLCNACRTKMQNAIQGQELNDNFVYLHRNELLSKGITENGLKHIQKAIDNKLRAEKKEAEKTRTKEELFEKTKQVIVTTGDLKRDYEVIGPVYFQVSNKGLFSSSLSDLKSRYSSAIQEMKVRGTMSENRADWGFLYGEWSVGQNDFEAAFFIATQELKKRAAMVGGDAVICMRQDIDMDTNGFAYFYLQMYGTAVRYI